jgi:hypothetical protein
MEMLNGTILSSRLPGVERKALAKKSLGIAPPLLPIAIQAVYSFEIIVPVVQRTEQGFPKDKTAFLLEFADVIGCAQIAVFKCLE